jgi:hypothetical protein
MLLLLLGPHETAAFVLSPAALLPPAPAWHFDVSGTSQRT